MQFSVARAARPTGEILQALIEEEARASEILLPRDAVVCYGAGRITASPAYTLNRLCSHYNKLEQGMLLRTALQENTLEIMPLDFPRGLEPGKCYLGRKIQHTKGKDITVAIESWQAETLLRSGKADFFTPYVPSIKEYRVWVYRNRHLGTYEKVLTRPEDFKKIGRNYANGFDFSHRESENVPETLKDVAKRAILALNLDFGAVDILETPEHQFIVLEVNSAPGVSNERRRVIQNLAHRIVRWAANDCPRRSNGIE